MPPSGQLQEASSHLDVIGAVKDRQLADQGRPLTTKGSPRRPGDRHPLAPSGHYTIILGVAERSFFSCGSFASRKTVAAFEAVVDVFHPARRQAGPAILGGVAGGVLESITSRHPPSCCESGQQAASVEPLGSNSTSGGVQNVGRCRGVPRWVKLAPAWPTARPRPRTIMARGRRARSRTSFAQVVVGRHVAVVRMNRISVF